MTIKESIAMFSKKDATKEKRTKLKTAKHSNSELSFPVRKVFFPVSRATEAFLNCALACKLCQCASSNLDSPGLTCAIVQ